MTKGNLGILRATIAQYYADHDGQFPTDKTLASITSGGGYLNAVPTKSKLGDDRRELRASGFARSGVVELLTDAVRSAITSLKDKQETDFPRPGRCH